MRFFSQNFRILFALSIFTFLASCDNTLDLIEDKIETPIVYSMLDYEAEYQFVRLERAFVSEGVSALELAKNPDSLYYKNASVKLTRIRNGVSLEKTLEQVDGNQTGYQREDGVFATAPNILYRIASTDFPLNKGDVVKLTIDIWDNEMVTAETKIIEKTLSSGPLVGKAFDFPELQPKEIEWKALLENGGKVHTCEFVFKYSEELDGQVTDKSLVWRIATNSSEQFVRLPGGAFYTFMGNNIEKNPNIKRYFNSFDYYIYSGDKNLADLLNVSNANNGITSSGEVPLFTNLSRGYGLFGSKAITKLTDLGLTVGTLTHLKENSLTKDLNFQ